MAQPGCRVAQLLVALELLRPDVQQPDLGLVEAEQDLGEDAAHDSELGEVLGIAFEVGAEIEHHRLAARRRQERGKRGPVGTFDHAHGKHRDRQQRAGVARRHDGVGAALRDGIDGQPHARLAAPAQCEGRLVLGQHGVLGRHDLERLGQALALVDQRLQPRRITEQQVRRAGIALTRDVGTVHDDLGA